jgi:hypothetical protein
MRVSRTFKTEFFDFPYFKRENMYSIQEGKNNRQLNSGYEGMLPGGFNSTIRTIRFIDYIYIGAVSR